ncbi:DEAD/DEAH box helicase [Aeromicrobium senzhongii]|uniref:DEAD/DEAH box helicase n=1 Tax=Aeromicrobium senzhongii TaxID=2663859 RepID=A0ABX6SS62_9ACTN|nr:DEAD/DEAH box helicase [Aeromicrobium senzhongii]MTB87074.1 DEAD/DEAH box helicase [Aeromicrobium senzhongii]QNL93110.1 DEAD/DEAH box helicase [Aeromicrobium senzhongii]
MSTPAEQYARFRKDRQHPHVAAFRDLYPFGLDEFQVRACEALEDGHGVLVAAPTGSGKTLVGEFAVHLSLATGRKCFYTTPIKALSNQKFSDFADRYGAENVGLLTGDNTINGEAPIVVMTTEVLRNMIYAGSSTLKNLGHVVMDEVHYLADRFRGAVWEEVIIGLPPSVSIVSLSATVSNVEEFGAWLHEVRGETDTIVEEKRPVPLHQHVLVGRKMFDLFEPNSTEVNHTLEQMARDDAQWNRAFAKNRSRRPQKGGRRPRSRHRTPDRIDIVLKLESEGMLPAIVFIFSRAGCATAVEQCLAARLILTSQEEREAIHAHVDAACAHLPEEDLAVLGFHEFREGIGRGIAAHHAGMLPTFKECVEDLFSAGLVKVVFATETLALGINMPARSVVIDRLTKWNGENHVDVTPGEYTQLTGRAGRRGIDVEGHGVVLWQPGLDARHVAGLASTRTYPLNSSFRPSYNMAVNLVHQVGRERARELLEMSFAQFQADRAVVGLARKVRKADEAIEGYRESATCEQGDFMEYMSLRRQLSDIESAGSKSRRAAKREEALESLGRLKRGDVINVPAGKFSGLAIVLDPDAGNRDGPRPMVLTANRHARRLAAVDFPSPVEPLTQMRIPKTFNPRDPQSRRDLASALRDRAGHLADHPRAYRDGPTVEDPRIAELRRQMRDHPCHSCPDRESHARWAERMIALDRETESMRRRVEQRTNSVARQFDRVCVVLDALGYLEGDDVTEEGRRLQRIYGESDLIVSESLRIDVWEGLSPPEFAAVASGLTYTARNSDDAPPPRFPTKAVAQAAESLGMLWLELDQLEREHRLKFLRRPDFGFAYAVWMWCEGTSLDLVLGTAEMAAGDFVRAMKQLIDTVAQIADAAGPGPVRDSARAALDELRTGVVAYSSVTS